VKAGLISVLALACATSVARAQPEPSGAHPRLFLDDAMRAAFKKQAKQAGPVKTAISYCSAASGGGRKYDNDRYMGFLWSSNVQACLVAWAATGDDGHAKTAIRYFTALLDDQDNVGDGKGGDNTVRRDSGYAIRLIGIATALAYDWLHDHKLMTDALEEKARGRFKAWLEWYIKDGYRPRSPGTNYHAGYLVSATLISIAQGGEAGAYGGTLWKHVVDDLWNNDMSKAMLGVPLAGGDWGEGWQYAPLSVTGYALSARAMTAAGVEVKGYKDWLTGLVVRHVYGMSPGRRQTFVGGDVENETPNLDINPMTMLAVLVGDSSDEARGWAASELASMKLEVGDEFRIYDAIAFAKPATAVEVPRKDWPTWYLARGVGNLYARAHWGKDSIWTVMQCTATIDIDHFHANAGNFVLSRGDDDVIVDPSPYGTLSTITSNAPTVESAHLPADYKPGQAWWSEKTKWLWAHQTRSGVVAGACDYADQYKFQHRPSDVPAARRDLVLVPWDDGKDGSLVVIDRAKSGEKSRGLHLRFRTIGNLALKGEAATAQVGSTQLSINTLSKSSGTASIARSSLKDCFSDKSTRGNCDAARFPVTDLRMVVEGPEMTAVHVIDASGKGGTAAAKLESGTGWSGVWLERKDGAAMVVYASGKPGGKLAYQAPAKAAMHVVVDAPTDKGGKATVTATAKDGGCAVSIAPGGAALGRPAVFKLDEACAVTDDPVLTGGPLLGGTSASTVADDGAPITQVGDGSGGAAGSGPVDDGRPVYGSGYPDQSQRRPSNPRTGCCGASGSPGGSIALSALVLGALVARRRRPQRAPRA
jgi:uncharacterized protein (TIGR03382 family)